MEISVKTEESDGVHRPDRESSSGSDGKFLQIGKDHFVCFGRSRTCMEQWYVHAHACMGMEASWSDSMGAKTVYGQLTPSGIEDRMVGEQVG
ncbi:hypothetical protein LXL04_018295 [Taraxacum kok-saghyz]